MKGWVVAGVLLAVIVILLLWNKNSQYVSPGRRPSNPTTLATLRVDKQTLDRFNGIPAKDQDGQTIQRYKNNTQQCMTDCLNNRSCMGVAVRRDQSQCWTLRGTPSMYSSRINDIYTKK